MGTSAIQNALVFGLDDRVIAAHHLNGLSISRVFHTTSAIFVSNQNVAELNRLCAVRIARARTSLSWLYCLGHTIVITNKRGRQALQFTNIVSL
jgi:hypothetical protein